MKTNHRIPARGLSIFALILLMFFSCNDEENPMPDIDMPGMAPDVSFTALAENNRIMYYHARDLGSPLRSLDVEGLESGEVLVSIDYRPATGQLYALGNSSRLYIIHEETGKAKALGEGPFAPSIQGENPSIDFNPTVDRIRLVTASGQNLRLHPELGNVVAEDGMISGSGMPQIAGVAYTNSMAGATNTELYDIDIQENKLFVQDPPNDGGLREVGDLGVDFYGMLSFDIIPDNSSALAVSADENESMLYTINLSSGMADWVGTFNQPINGIAFKTNPVAFATDADNQLFRFDPTNPSMNPVTLDGLMSGEMIVGLDFRPANGALYALSSESRLFTVNTANGQLMAVGDGLVPGLYGDAFGFDFNPTVDRIRLVSNTGQNLRLHPDLGTVVAEDGDLNPGTPMVSAAAYTNNFHSPSSTLLYVLDHGTNMLYTQDPPNDGVLNEVGHLGIDFSSENGFDIGGESGMAFAFLEVEGNTGVYTINLMDGSAEKMADFNIMPTAMAVGLGF